MTASFVRFLRHGGVVAGVMLRGRRSADLALVVAAVLTVSVSTLGWAWSVDTRSDALDDRLAAAGPGASAVIVRFADGVVVDFGPSPLASALAEVDTATRTFPDPLVELLDDENLVADTNAFTIETIDEQPLATPSTLNFRVQRGLDERSTLVVGRRPAPQAIDDVVEVAVSVETARELALGVGDVMAVSLDLDDPLTSRLRGFPAPFEVEVVGIVDLDDVDDPFWFGDARLHRPIVDDTPLGAERRAFVALSEAAVVPAAPFVVDRAVPLAIEWRTRIDLDELSLGNVADIGEAIAQVEATTTRTAGAGNTAVVIGLADVLTESEVERSAAVDVVSLLIAGWAVAGLAMLGELNLRRVVLRRQQLALLARRGTGRPALLVGVACSTGVVTAVGVVGGSIVGAAGSRVLGFGGLPWVALAVAASLTIVVPVAAGTLHVATEFRSTRSSLPGGLLVMRLDDRPPRWGRVGAVATIAVILGWIAGVAILWRTAIRAVDALVVVVIIGLPVVAALVTHQRSGRRARWPAIAAGGAVVSGALVAVTRTWSPTTDGATADDLAAGVRAQLLMWTVSAVVAAAMAIAVHRPEPTREGVSRRSARSLDALVAACGTVLVGLAVVGGVLLARLDLDGVGRAVERSPEGGLAAACAVVALLVTIAFATRRSIEPPTDPPITGDGP